MNFYIPIHQNVQILPMDLIKSPKGQFFTVVGNLGEEILRVRPMEAIETIDTYMEFSIKKNFLIQLGWKKKIS